MRDNYFLLCSLKDTHCTDNSIHFYLLLFLYRSCKSPEENVIQEIAIPVGDSENTHFTLFLHWTSISFTLFFSFQERNIGYKVYIHQMHVHLYINFNNPMSAILLMKSHRHTFTLVTD